MLRLLKPIDYLRISHPTKRWVDLWVPIGVSALALALMAAAGQNPQIFEAGGLIIIFSPFLYIMVGFFIAALAVVASFNAAGMDDPLPGEAVTITEWVAGELKPVQLTRRRLCTMMFGYLTFLALILSAVGLFLEFLRPALCQIFNLEIRIPAAWVFAFFYLAAFTNLITTTLHGLFYLSDRIHRGVGKPRPKGDKHNGAASPAE